MLKSVLVQHVQSGRVSFCPVGRVVSVGRGSENDVVCQDRYVSRHHCDLVPRGDGQVEVIDRSTYGTSIDGRRVSGQGVARPGNLLSFGHDYTIEVIGVLDPDASHSEDPEPVPPRRLGANYILLRELGRGGMGIVYEAWDEREGRRCAIKWLRGGGTADKDAVDRFKREVMLQGRLGEYPGIVSIFDLGAVTGSGELFCVMEFVDGESFLTKMRAQSITREEGVRLIARVARAVAYAHSHDVIHRDIKPGNIMVTANGQVRLTDFGIAKALDDTGCMTVTGLMIGTPGYMAPEQIESSKDAGKPADIYALGALLFSFLTGKLPIRGRNIRDALDRARRGEIGPSPRELDSTIDPVLEAACRRALAYRPEDRWSSADAFAEELERYLRETTTSGRIRLQAPGGG